MTERYEQNAAARTRPLSAARVRSIAGLAHRRRERGFGYVTLATGGLIICGAVFTVLLIGSSLITAINEGHAPVSVQSEPFTQVAVAVVESRCVPAARRLRDAIEAPDADIPREAIDDAWHLVEQCRRRQSLRSAAGLPEPASSAITAFAEYVLATSAGRDGSDESHGHRTGGTPQKPNKGLHHD